MTKLTSRTLEDAMVWAKIVCGAFAGYVMEHAGFGVVGVVLGIAATYGLCDLLRPPE